LLPQLEKLVNCPKRWLDDAVNLTNTHGEFNLSLAEVRKRYFGRFQTNN
jgi:hypothetical protein